MAINLNYSVLAAAIVKSGIKENDKHFLESSWCADLRELITIGQTLRHSGNHISSINKIGGPKYDTGDN